MKTLAFRWLTGGQGKSWGLEIAGSSRFWASPSTHVTTHNWQFSAFNKSRYGVVVDLCYIKNNLWILHWKARSDKPVVLLISSI